MTDGFDRASYRCPECYGGFPATALDDNGCPWCGTQLGEVEPGPRVAKITRRSDDDCEERSGIVARLLS